MPFRQKSRFTRVLQPRLDSPSPQLRQLVLRGQLNRTLGILRQQQPLSDHLACGRPRDPASRAFFDTWLDGILHGNNVGRTRQLGQWSRAPGGRASHPQEEHLIPLMEASGAGGHAAARRLWAGMVGPTHLGGWVFD